MHSWNNQSVTKWTKYGQNQKTPFKSQKFKNKKTSLSEDFSNIWCDVFALSKIVFLEFFFGFGGKVNVSIYPFFASKIKIFTIVKTSPSQENIKINYWVFVWIKKNYFEGCFWFWQHRICFYLLLHCVRHICIQSQTVS